MLMIQGRPVLLMEYVPGVGLDAVLRMQRTGMPPAEAVEIVRQAGYDASVARITSDALDRPAERPAYSALDTTSYAVATGDTQPPVAPRTLAWVRMNRNSYTPALASS